MERTCRGSKDRDGNVLTGAKCVMGRWKDSFDEPMNEENERENVQLEKLLVWIRKYLRLVCKLVQWRYECFLVRCQ